MRLPFVKTLIGLSAGLLILTDGTWMLRTFEPQEEIPDEHRFRKVVLSEDIADPTDMDILPDGSILITEQKGTLKLYKPATRKTVTAGKLPIINAPEAGLMSVALDPKFSANRWVYLLYSPDSPAGKKVNYLSRFTFRNDSIDKQSEKVVLEIPDHRACCHSGAGLTFDPAGNLYITTGDNTNPFGTNYAPQDEREGRTAYDAQRTSANTQDLRGKVLRIHPEPDGSYTVPAGNLFADKAQGRPEIYIMGCRNPYKLTVDKRTNFLYWGEVGPDASDDDPKGPRGYDEINQARTAGNHGWPYFIGDNYAYAEVDFRTDSVGPRYNPAAPENPSVNNTGARQLPPARKPLIWYPYDQSEQFPQLGSGGRTIVMGQFYYHTPQNPSPVRFPAYFDGALFIGEWMRNWIKVVRLEPDGSLDRIEDFMPSTSFNKPVGVKFGNDGALYVLEFGSLWGGNNDSRLVRVEYIKGNRPPVAALSADQLTGPAPLRVRFSPKGTFDYDKGDGLTYAWSFAGGGTQATGEEPEYVFTKPGVYEVKLTVRDKAGASSSATTRITVGNSIPRVTVQRLGRSPFYGDTVHYAVAVEDAEDGSLAAGTIDPTRVKVTLEYLPEGNVALDGKGQPVTAALRGGTWIAESDCKACHAESKKSVGPAFNEIAGHYAAKKDDPKLIDKLATKILQGGYGVWGEVNMSAHPQLSREVAAEMVRYILSLNSGKTPPQPLSAKGSFATGLSTGNRTGTYLLRAAYTDKGGQGVGPLANETVLLLRSPKVPARDFDQVYEVKKTDILSNVNKDGYALLKNIDLTGIRSITCRTATETKGSTIELRLGSPTGKLLGRTDVPVGKWKDWQDLKVPIEPIEGSHDLYLVFKNRLYVLSLLELEWVYFE